VLIRAAQPDDVSAISDLEAVSFPTPWTRESLSSAVGQAYTLSLVAVDPGAFPPVVGYVLLRLTQPDAELLRIAVRPERRLAGLGSTLLEETLAALRSAGISRCFLEVRSDNQAALGLYRRYDAREISRRPAYYRDGTDALVLSLAIGVDTGRDLS
jgi:ribosomal-protein-alanine acetyltransferase